MSSEGPPTYVRAPQDSGIKAVEPAIRALLQENPRMPATVLAERVGWSGSAAFSRGGLWLDPVLPEAYGDLHITNALMADGRITIDISGSTTSVQGLPEGMVLHSGHRPWMTELVRRDCPATLWSSYVAIRAKIRKMRRTVPELDEHGSQGPAAGPDGDFQIPAASRAGPLERCRAAGLSTGHLR